MGKRGRFAKVSELSKTLAKSPIPYFNRHIDIRFQKPFTDSAPNENLNRVVEIQVQTSTVMIGIVVDSVSEVLNIKGEEIEETKKPACWARAFRLAGISEQSPIF